MANRTNLSSWGNLRDYLKTNVDPDKDWDNEEIKDYNHLLGAQAAGKVSGDKFTEGRNLFQHYLADAQATDVYQQAQAKAENDARKESEYADFLTTRLASYLPQLQGNAGIKGYLGLTDGQSVALLNNQENTLRAIQGEKRTALQKALETYQGALASNSATAIDQATAIDAARDKKIADEKNIQDQKFAEEEDRVRSRLNEYIMGAYDALEGGYVGGIITEDGKISETDTQKILDYINKANLSDESRKKILDDFYLKYGDSILTPEIIKNEINEIVDIVSKDNYSDVMNAIEENKEALGDEYASMVSKVNEKMNAITHTYGEGYVVDFSTGSMVPTSNITVKINDKTLKYVLGEYVDNDTAKALNQVTTGSDSNNPVKGTIVLKDGKFYVFHIKTENNGWREIKDSTNKVSELGKAWNEYDPNAKPVADNPTVSTSKSESLSKNVAIVNNLNNNPNTGSGTGSGASFKGGGGGFKGGGMGGRR